MRELKGRVTLLFDAVRGMSIEIEDDNSGVSISAQLSPENTLKVLSSQAYVKCDVSFPDKEFMHLIGKTRECRRVRIENDWGFEKPSPEFILKRCEFESIFDDKDGKGTWSLYSTGLTSQQNTQGKHEVIIERYVD
jgi:hypothetical protein